MSSVWYPAATQNPGAAANYQLGRNDMQCVKCHFTVGVDSTTIGLNGYFQFLISRDGTVQQFAPVDALCYDSGEANATGPGIEVEYLPGTDTEVFTGPARDACGLLVRWLADEWHIPLSYHDGNHDTQPGSYAGFLSHKSIIQTEEHQDFWPQADWDAMTAITPPIPPAQKSEEDTQVITQLFGPDGLLYITVVGQAGNVFVTKIDPKNVPDQGKPKTVESYAELTGFVGCPTPSGWK